MSVRWVDDALEQRRANRVALLIRTARFPIPTATIGELDYTDGRGINTVGIDPEAASDLFAILANREHRRPTMIASQSGPDYWMTAQPDRVAADSIVNRLANNARTITLGDIDMRRQHHQKARAANDFWEQHHSGRRPHPGRRPLPTTRTALPETQTTATNRRYSPA